MADVPDLALDVLVAAVDALAEPVVEPAEVAAALAVDPAETLELVVADDGLDVGETERAAAQPAPALVELELGGDVDDRDDAIAVRGSRRGPAAARPLGSSKKNPPWSGVWNSTHCRIPGARLPGTGAPWATGRPRGGWYPHEWLRKNELVAAFEHDPFAADLRPSPHAAPVIS